MSAYTDAHDERFGKSTWFAKPTPEALNFALCDRLDAAQRDDDLTTARRRRVLLDALDDVEATG